MRANPEATVRTRYTEADPAEVRTERLSVKDLLEGHIEASEGLGVTAADDRCLARARRSLETLRARDAD